MNETDLFYKDAMFWREVNFYLPAKMAELELSTAMDIGGEDQVDFVEAINGYLLSFDSHTVEYEMENGGSFTKNEVKSWPIVLMEDVDFYQNESNSEADRKARIKHVPHENLKAITIKNGKGEILLRKAKV